MDASPAELTPTDYRVGVLGESAVTLPVVTAAGKPSPAGPLARSAAPGQVQRELQLAHGWPGDGGQLRQDVCPAPGPRS